MDCCARFRIEAASRAGLGKVDAGFEDEHVSHPHVLPRDAKHLKAGAPVRA